MATRPPQGQPGVSANLPWIVAARGERDAVLPGADGIGGGLSVPVTEVRGFEHDVVGPRTREEARS